MSGIASWWCLSSFIGYFLSLMLFQASSSFTWAVIWLIESMLCLFNISPMFVLSLFCLVLTNNPNWMKFRFSSLLKINFNQCTPRSTSVIDLVATWYVNELDQLQMFMFYCVKLFVLSLCFTQCLRVCDILKICNIFSSYFCEQQHYFLRWHRVAFIVHTIL